MINIQIHLLRNSKGQLVTIYKIVSFFVFFFSNRKTQVIYLQLTRKFTFSSVSNQQQHSGFLHLDDVFFPEGEPFMKSLHGFVRSSGFNSKEVQLVLSSPQFFRMYLTLWTSSAVYSQDGKKNIKLWSSQLC